MNVHLADQISTSLADAIDFSREGVKHPDFAGHKETTYLTPVCDFNCESFLPAVVGAFLNMAAHRNCW